MKHSTSWETNRSSAGQEISHILWNPKVHFRIQKRPPTVAIWTRPVQSRPPHSTSWIPILILSSHLRLGRLSVPFPSSFPTKTSVYTSLISHTYHMPLPTHFSWSDHQNYTWWGVKIISFSLCSFLQSPVTSTLLGPNTFFSILFSKTLILYSSINVRVQAS